MSEQPQPRENMIAMLDAEGVAWEWMYPGVLVMEPVPGYRVNTALVGYEYGSIYNDEGTDLGSADPADDSADAWRSWLRGFVAGHVARTEQAERESEQV